METYSNNIKEGLILGRVTDSINRPLANLSVQAYDRDMRSEELLGESVTDKNGNYRITWSPDRLIGREKKTADLSLKVFTREKKTLLYETDIEAIRFNASGKEEIDIIIKTDIPTETVEYDFILNEVTFLAGEVAIQDLQETKEHRDVTFLSREAEIPAIKIEHLVVAHRVQAESKIDAAFFYALLRKNTLLKNDFNKPLQARLVIDIHVEILPLLYDAALTDVKTIQTDITAAVKEYIVPARVSREWKKQVELLRQYKQAAEEYQKNEQPRKVMDMVSRFVMADKIGELENLFRENKNDPAGFFRKITDDSFFKSPGNADDAKATLALGELLGFDEFIISQVKESQKIEKPGDLKKLAALNKADWKSLLTQATDKMEIAGKPLDKKQLDLHASSLVRKMEKEFPTAAFAAQLSREKKSLYKNQAAMGDFFYKHDDFDLRHSQIDLFFKEKNLAADENSVLRQELKSLQRVFKLVPHYSKTNALLQMGIHSSQGISALGETRFVKEIAPKAGIQKKEAKAIFKKAQQTHTAAMLIAGELQDTIRTMNIPALEMGSLALKIASVSSDFPNLKSLFNLTDVCTCEHCRSVYSPAAYLVEILQFLDNRSVTDLTTMPHTTGHLAKDVLFARRPDLGEIDLSCANATTPLPYIDLVCELLEEATAPDPGIPFSGVLSDGGDPLTGKISNALFTALQTAGIPVTDQAQIYATEVSSGSSAALPHYLRDKKAVCKIIHNGGNNYTVFRLRQTLSSAEELAAAPEYVNQAAYDVLRNNAFAFTLPFDLNHTEATAYFSRFDISRAELMADFRTGGTPTLEATAAETLGLTDAERKLIVTPDSANQQKYWNTTVPTASDEMKIVDTFLTKTGMAYKELDLLLTLAFIDQGNKLFIKHLDLSCDTEQKEIANLDDTVLDRIHRFLRLQKKTGWKFETLDEIISQAKLGNGQLDNACLIMAANLLKLSTETGLKMDILTGFYGDIPHRVLKDNGPLPLYHQVFLDKAKNGFIDEGLLPEKVNGSQLLNTFKTALSVSLKISQQDFDKLLATLPNGDLTFANLSSLYAATRLMQNLKLKTDDFIILETLIGINFQDTPQATYSFVKAVKASREFPLKPADLQFMLKHEATNLADRELKDEKIKQLLENLQANYQEAFKKDHSPFNPDITADDQKETLQNLLAGLNGVSEEDVKTMVGFIDRDWASANAAKAVVTAKLGGLFDVASINTRIDGLDTAPGPGIETEQNLLMEAFMKAIASYRFDFDKQNLLELLLASAFKSNADQVKTLLSAAVLKQPAPGTDLIKDILLSDTLIDTDTKHAAPMLPVITSVAFPKHYLALRLLHKLVPLIQAFKWEDSETQWYLTNNAAMTWFQLDGIPYQMGQTAAAYSKYAAFVEMLSRAKRLTPVPNPADAENPITFRSVLDMLLPGSTATRAAFIEKFSLLTGYAKEDTDAVDAYLFPVFGLNAYREAETWKTVETCVEYVRKLGSTVSQIKEFIKPVLTGTDTQLIRMALKARYDESTWLTTLKEIMDAIRPQKRNALVAYLLAVNPDIKDENGLYDYFLVDVEMEVCMPSSRIVQAHGTIQLFVQRCLMGLEPKAAADVDNDKSWEQWKWMKNYRVWEANRKVFLYPENWIEAELRDDKSFLFTEMENELQQNELTEFTAEEALIRYLEKLDDIAFLEVVATWYQSDIKTMHVFARTKGGDPEIYYYRKFEQERYWTPWEKVELDISGDHLLAFVRNNRLTLAWPIFTEEPDSEQKSAVPDIQNPPPGNEMTNDRPKRKLKIQLAISQFANQKWQPKKISKQGILTPSTSTPNSLPKDRYNLIYFEMGDQVWLFSTGNPDSYLSIQLNGIFNIAGCKGYPELLFGGELPLPDFFPDFKDTLLEVQRYHEMNKAPDDLAARNILSPFNYFEILNTTPGTFRLTYPHQFTIIDLVAWLIQYLSLSILGNKLRDRSLKLPLGTLLPYFMENSHQAYAIIPGFYSRQRKPEDDEVTQVRRTASDVMKLIKDIIALYSKYMAKYKADPGQDVKALLKELVEDNDYQAIVSELKVYGTLQYGEQFKNLYHPLVCALRKTLYKDGIGELMKRETQLQTTAFNFNSSYQPSAVVPFPYPVEDIDFESDGSYSGYNWELFFHVPFLIATRLTRDQQFEGAMTWFHYMFNPTGALSGSVPQKYWVTKPFYLTQSSDYIAQRIDTLLYNIADPSSPAKAELEFAIDQWRNKPFKPHVVARFRPVAYQKALLMKYIDNLTEWGDYLFRQDTMESIVQATQMYILADKLLGPKPRNIPPVLKPPYETYNQVEARLDTFGNALIDLENILPDLSVLPEGGDELPPIPVTLSMLYFCIPQNEKMLEYWDRIEDRLFKIRNCQNIDGVERTLALFAPPIDPGMLVRAAAAGLDISSILAGMNAPLPHYRFNVLSQKASELTQEVRGLGSSLLQALEKKDAEAMALLRSELEINMLKAVKDMKLLQIEEAKEQIEILNKTRAVTEERKTYYANIEKIIDKEQLNLDKLSEAQDYQFKSQIVRTVAGALALIPEFHLGASGFGGSPHVVMQLGGSAMSRATNIGADILNILGSVASFEANRASILGGYDRRYDDWKLQERLAKKELDQIEKQIAAAEIRKEIAETDLKNHELQIENAKKTDDFMRSKFTNKELYEWMIGQISSVYFKAYQLAHDFAKKAERSYRFELGNDDTFIQYGYWDSMKKGLQSADHLLHDIKRMETAYLDKNKREYEITRHISLAQLDPLALVQLRATGVCDFDVPEALFDMDYAGHYFRRIKSVSLSLPCIAGAYTSVSAKLSLVSNKYRKNTNPDNLNTTGYYEDLGNDERFVYNVGAIQSIATSNAQNDAGMFELNFRDERYLPFEGTGAISSWRLELPKDVHLFDYHSIADVIIHLKYTAREGGSILKKKAEQSLKDRLTQIKQQLSETGMHLAIDLKHDRPNEWHLLKTNGNVNLVIDKSNFPYLAQTLAAAVENVMFIAKVKNNPTSYPIAIDGSTLDLTKIIEWELYAKISPDIDLNTAFALSVLPAQLSDLEELMMVVKYSF